VRSEVQVTCAGDFCVVPPGEAQSFGFVFSYTATYVEPNDTVLSSSTCNNSTEANDNDSNSDAGNSTASMVSDTFNYILGTQTIQP